jgi:hypothetical protein
LKPTVIPSVTSRCLGRLLIALDDEPLANLENVPVHIYVESVLVTIISNWLNTDKNLLKNVQVLHHHVEWNDIEASKSVEVVQSDLILNVEHVSLLRLIETDREDVHGSDDVGLAYLDVAIVLIGLCDLMLE